MVPSDIQQQREQNGDRRREPILRRLCLLKTAYVLALLQLPAPSVYGAQIRRLTPHAGTRAGDRQDGRDALGASFARRSSSQYVDFGFQTASVYAAHVSLPRAKYPEPPQRERFLHTADRSAAAPARLANAGAISYLPMSGSNYGFIF